MNPSSRKVSVLSSWVAGALVLALCLGPANARPGRVDQGPVLLDVNPGANASSGPADLTPMGGTVFFFATDASHGNELWKSDGTAGGTVLVKDINPGAAGSFPGELTLVGETLFFRAFGPTSGLELWKSDGTAAGTVLVKDINPGFASGTNPRSSIPTGLVDVGGTLFFSANDDVHGPELWMSDGTETSTVLVKDINTGFSAPTSLTSMGGTLFFVASGPASGAELWKSDGTEAGTVLVKDILPGTSGSNPNFLTVVEGTLFFGATDPTNGNELWKSDGTEAGTILVKDINPGFVSGTFPRSSFPQRFAAVGDTLFLVASDPANGMELWKSDGTADGTVLVKDINPGAGTSNPLNLVRVGGTLFFAVSTDVTNGRELWKSDGTAGGTVLVKDINPGSSGSSAFPQLRVGLTLYFSADDGVAGNELWKSDGTADGTVLVADLNPGAGGSFPFNMAQVEGLIFFSAFDGSQNELWVLNLSVTVRVADVLAEMDRLMLAHPGTSLEDKLEDAQAKIQEGLDKLAGTTPDGSGALGELEGAVGDLEAAINDGLLAAAPGADMMDALSGSGRQVATDAINAAIAQSGDAGKIAEAQALRSDGDALRAEGSFKDALAKYKDALGKAKGAGS